MKRHYLGTLGAALGAAALWLTPLTADACGGFFCGVSPVDQNAERIVFAVGESSTEMIVQINYTGDSEDFAWVLPLVDAPDPTSLDTFPDSGLTFLDQFTNNIFVPQDTCPFPAVAAVAESSLDGDSSQGSVQVILSQVVGPYDVAVIASEDPRALVPWLRDNRYNVVESMVPFIEDYASKGLKLLALRLTDDKDSDDIEALRLTLPGTSPNIPLQLTAVAAQPPLALQVYVLAADRFAPAAPWRDILVSAEDLVFTSGSPFQTNWRDVIERSIAEEGPGFATEYHDTTETLLASIDSQLEGVVSTINNNPGADFLTGLEDQRDGLEALKTLTAAHARVTRLFASLPAKFMSSDPTFKRTENTPVSRTKEVAGLQPFCSPDPISPCLGRFFGEGSLCLEPGTGSFTPRIACLPGATARLTANGEVNCEDLRMSFLNPGEASIDSDSAFPDPCVGYDCGTGRCIAQNLTPTCICELGTAATAVTDSDGTRRISCVAAEVPTEFYAGRLSEIQTLSQGRVSAGIDYRELGFPDEEGFSESSVSSASNSACALKGGPSSGLSLFAGLGLLALRRRRRRALGR